MAIQVIWKRGPPRAESKDPLNSPESDEHGTLPGFGGSLDYGVALLHLRSG